MAHNQEIVVFDSHPRNYCTHLLTVQETTFSRCEIQVQIPLGALLLLLVLNLIGVPDDNFPQLSIEELKDCVIPLGLSQVLDLSSEVAFLHFFLLNEGFGFCLIDSELNKGVHHRVGTVVVGVNLQGVMDSQACLNNLTT